MDRLTHYDKDGRTFSSRGYEIALSRLAAYEDTGMDPGQVKDWANLGFGPALAKCCHDELDKLCNLVGGLDRLREICAAEKDGRLVVLPCKVGDTVYLIVHGYVEDTKVRTFFCGHPSYNGGEPDPRYEMVRCTNYDLPMKSFGKTVFLTRAEADAALKGTEHERD